MKVIKQSLCLCNSNRSMARWSGVIQVKGGCFSDVLEGPLRGREGPHPHIPPLPDRSVDVGETTSTSVWGGETGFHGRSLGKEKTRDRLKICMLMIGCLSP